MLGDSDIFEERMSTITIHDNGLIGKSYVRDDLFIVRYHHYIHHICYDNTCVFTYDNDRNKAPMYDYGDYDIHWFNPEMDVWGQGAK